MEPPPPRHCPQCTTPLVQRVEVGRERLACPSCGYVFWNNPVPVVAAIVEVGDKVLLGRKQPWPPGRWGLVAGFLEAGETMEEGVLRELREETGLEGEVVGLVGVYPILHRNQVFLVYRVRATGTWQVGEELEALREFSRDELPAVLEHLPPQSGSGRALRAWMEKL